MGAVVNAGQAVHRGQLPQLLLQQCSLCHIDQHNHSSGQAAVLLQDGGSADLVVAGAAADIPGQLPLFADPPVCIHYIIHGFPAGRQKQLG
ncbi:hypothetical protein D3C75_1170880 [compost metagenome]